MNRPLMIIAIIVTLACIGSTLLTIAGCASRQPPGDGLWQTL